MTVRTHVQLALPFLALGWLAAPSSAQSVLYVFFVHSPDYAFGTSVSGAGDVNGDGHADLIIGYPYSSSHGEFSGSALVFSGADGTNLYTFEGDSKQDYFGGSVSGAGDVNGDGFADLIVGAAGDDPNGSTYVFSGKDGSVLYTFEGESFNTYFGSSVSGAGDVNGDGIPDLIVGAPYDSTFSSFAGSAWVFSGADGSILHTFYGKKAKNSLGSSVSGAGDVNGDGFADLIVGVPYSDQHGKYSGSARVFSGKNGKVLHIFHGDSGGDFFGTSVSGAGDVNGDGFADLIVGAPEDKKNRKGTAWVFSGADGSTLHILHGEPGDLLGYSVGGAGDVNGDGFDDVIIGATETGSWPDHPQEEGYALVLSGKDWSVIHTFDGDKKGDYFGFPVSSAGDVNGDGFDDLVVGAPYSDTAGEDSGSAWVFSGCDACVIGTNYCGPANPNSTGQPAAIEAFGNRFADRNFLRLTALQLPAQQLGYFLNSQTQGFVPFAGGSQGNLCLGGEIGRHNDQIQNSGSAGEFSIQVNLTMLPTPGGTHSVIAGETWNFQAWFRDDDPGPTSNFTDGVSITFL